MSERQTGQPVTTEEPATPEGDDDEQGEGAGDMGGSEGGEESDGKEFGGGM